MFYLITIKGHMINGRFITKNPPPLVKLKHISDVGKKNKGEIVSVLPLSWEEICMAVDRDPERMNELIDKKEVTENQIIRKYLDKTNENISH